MTRLLSLLSLASGLLLLYLAWLISSNAEAAVSILRGANGFMDIFADIFVSVLIFYFLHFLAIFIGVIGIAIILMGITGLLNTSAALTSDNAISTARMAKVAVIRTWTSRVAWTIIIIGAGYFGLQLFRQYFGADIKFFDYFVFGGTWVMLGILVHLFSAIGGLIVRVIIRRS
ncbi:MAG: hypothetical protein ABJM29_00045 [Rhizobiaceae bacterium]